MKKVSEMLLPNIFNYIDYFQYTYILVKAADHEVTLVKTVSLIWELIRMIPCPQIAARSS